METDPAKEAHGNGDRSVLVVEDDREINELVGAYAEIAGFEYRAALDGSTALREAHERVPSAVVLDLMLPDIDGFEVCTRLKSEADTRGVPVIILTAMSGEANRKKGHACGASEYLTKPFDPDSLMAALERYASNGHS
jgi:two-component system phosphate regulon response regulator PhoB